ncbi:hypothetical protein N9386_00950 [Gammaproteobacteria bacterium]|nr:hypothetical protein [Gammaproteobacteria bacterium]
MLESKIHIQKISNFKISDKGLKNAIKKLCYSPELFPYQIDFTKKTISFIQMDKQAYKKSFFILLPGDGPGFLKGKNPISIDLSEIIDVFNGEPYLNKSAIIYNHGFCCSTLLARLLEESHKIISLKEPPLLNTLKHFLENNDAIDIKETIFGLHNRTFCNNERALWKPSDYAFDLIDETQKLNIPSILLYSPLREYIASCLKDKRREWIKNRADYVKICASFNIDLSEIDIQKTSIQATLYWCNFAKKFICHSKNGDNLAALNSSTLLNNPQIIDAVGKHLGLNKKFNIFKKRNTKKLLSTYVKTDNYEFNAEIRNQQLSKIIKKNIYDIEESEELASQIVNKSLQNFGFDNEIF